MHYGILSNFCGTDFKTEQTIHCLLFNILHLSSFVKNKQHDQDKQKSAFDKKELIKLNKIRATMYSRIQQDTAVVQHRQPLEQRRTTTKTIVQNRSQIKYKIKILAASE